MAEIVLGKLALKQSGSYVSLQRPPFSREHEHQHEFIQPQQQQYR